MSLMMTYSCSSHEQKGTPTLIPYGVEVEPERGFGEGVSGAFAGQVGEWLVWGGGCNFPSYAPQAKAYYNCLYATRPRANGTWETVELPPLKVPCGYGASLASESGERLYFVGGTDGSSARREVYQVSLVGGVPHVELLEVGLPFGWYEGSAALVGDDLYLVGGWHGDVGSNMAPLLQMVRLSLSTGESNELLTLEEGARIQPVLFYSGGALYLFGGYCPSVGTRPPHMQEQGYKVKLTGERELLPRRPLVQLEHGERALLFVGSAVARDPQSGEVYLAGGVDWEIFEKAVLREFDEAKARSGADSSAEELTRYDEARRAYLAQEPEAYRFMPALLRFVPQTATWEVVMEDGAFATAGAALTAYGKKLYLVGGERKPRVRTPDIWGAML